MRKMEQLFIGGKWVKPSSGDVIEVIDAGDESLLGTVPVAKKAEVDKAVRAARQALGKWADTPVAVRAELLEKAANNLKARGSEIAEVISREVGMPLKMSQRIQAALPVIVMDSCAKVLREFPFEVQIANSRVFRVPKGVVVAITPWNYPLHQLVGKVAPALAAGCTVVAKPASEAPLSAFMLAEALEAAWFPPGVFNLLSGNGPETANLLVQHDDVDMISFTGSTSTGTKIAATAAATAKRVTLELGGKSPSLVLDDADFPKALRTTVNNCFLNSGQTCNALTRLLVPRNRLTEVEELVLPLVAGMTLGDPGDPNTKLGPLVSARQRDRVRQYIKEAIQAGTRLLIGGDAPPEGLSRGFYVRPTVFTDVDPGAVIAQEEVFGPVLCIIGYRDLEEAVAIANGTPYGLAAAVWSADTDRALQVARRIRAGQIDINGAPFNALAPFGGFKHSGYGRELGVFGLEEFLEPLSIQLSA
ncbi:MAG: aldehyde dehydrogenase family protein [Deltaproteobacteria bacterium]|nr:aldehyde dehydrogenase family protein [Deltaproteobacteria bacterium]